LEDSLKSSVNATISNFQTGLLSKTHLLWTSFHVPSLNFQAIISTFLTIQGIFFFFDYLYRIILSVKLVSKYWSRGIVELPTISIVDSIEEKLETKFTLMATSTWASGVNYFLVMLPYIWMQLMVLIIFVIILLTIVSGESVQSFFRSFVLPFFGCC
jgi:hypothetical protein